jgi:N-acyl-D-amino-acid deacylase
MFDLVIRHADLIDGTGAPPKRADLAVRDGRIEEVGIVPADAESIEEIDASGMILAPGFIDIHTHADIALLSRPEHLPKIMQGVTTEVFTNCGLGFAPATIESLPIQRDYLLALFGDDLGVDWGWQSVGELLTRYERRGIATNIAYLIPHGAARVAVMGMVARPATKEERERIERLVRESMEAGAWGLSTGLWYAPMCYADRQEIVSLCRVAGFFATHQRDYGDQLFEATRESLEIAREAGVPVQISHLQMNGPNNAGRAGELLALLEEAQRQGVDVTCDTYPYTAGSTFLQSLLPTWATDGGPSAILQRLTDESIRDQIVDSLNASGRDWSLYTLAGANSAANRPLEGLPFDRIAKVRGMSVAEWICTALMEDELRACYIHHAAHEGNVREILQWKDQMIASDGLHLTGKCHPRLYGTFPRVLGYYVRETRTLTLAEAVYKMTGAPAWRLGLQDRGIIQKGKAADLVLFDPAAICDTATYEDPLRFPDGISHVWVNGTPVKQNHQPTYALPGRVLRRE